MFTRFIEARLGTISKSPAKVATELSSLTTCDERKSWLSTHQFYQIVSQPNGSYSEFPVILNECMILITILHPEVLPECVTTPDDYNRIMKLCVEGKKTHTINKPPKRDKNRTQNRISNNNYNKSN